MTRLFAITLTLFVLAGCDDVPDPSLPNEPPEAFDDNVSLKQNEVTIVDALANDFDIDGDITEIAVTVEASNGVAEVIDGVLFYTPDLYFVGSDQFEYQVTDIAGFTDTATVFLEIEKKEVFAILGTDTGLYAIDSRDPGTLVDLAQAVPEGETMIAWVVSEELQQAAILTDAVKVITVALDEPDVIVRSIDIDTTNGEPDGGFVLSNNGEVAIVSLANRYLVAMDLADVEDNLEFDNGWEDGTMLPTAFSILDTTIVMEGTLGTGSDERSAIYVAPLSPIAPIQVLDDPDTLLDTFTRTLDGLNAMLWLTIDPAVEVSPAAYSCTAPPPQALSVPSYTSLGLPDAGTDLIEASQILPDPTTLISYHNGPDTLALVVAACPSGAELFQLVEIPYLDPTGARVIATATDASDGLWNVDVGPEGLDVIYALEGDTGFRTIAIDLSDFDPVETDLSAAAAGYQPYASGMDTVLPPSMVTEDRLRWVYLAPVDDALTRLEWLQLADQSVDSVELPFAATNFTSNGLHAVVQGATGTTDPAPVALIELASPTVTPVDLPGALAERVEDPLNQVQTELVLVTIP